MERKALQSWEADQQGLQYLSRAYVLPAIHRLLEEVEVRHKDHQIAVLTGVLSKHRKDQQSYENQEDSSQGT